MGVLTRLLLSLISGMRGVFLKEVALKYCPQHNTGYQQPRVMCQKERMRTWDLLNTVGTTWTFLPFLPVPFPVSLSALTTAISSGRPEGDHTIVWHSHQHNSFSLSFSITHWLKSQRSGKKTSRPLPVLRSKTWNSDSKTDFPGYSSRWECSELGKSYG